MLQSTTENYTGNNLQAGICLQAGFNLPPSFNNPNLTPSQKQEIRNYCDHIIHQYHQYSATDFRYSESPMNPETRKVYQKYDHLGYHYRCYWNDLTGKVFYCQISQNHRTPLKKGDLIGQLGQLV